MNDDEPVVIVDDADLAALPAVGDLSAASQAYLRSQGVTDAATWAAFRLDQVGDAPGRLLSPSSNRRPSKTGLWLPTCDPRNPESITGLIRLTPAQNLHGFRSAPAGLAGAVDLDQRSRVVLADNPLLTLKLYQAGVADVALVEDPAVLAPLHDWLATRAVVLLSTKATGLEALRAGLGSIVPVHSKQTMAGRLSADIRDLLGTAPAAPLPALPITPHVLHELKTYAQSRLDAGEAAAMLTAFGAVPDLVKAYRVGFLPSNYRTALSAAARRMMLGHRCGTSLVLPALDAAGQVVDLCIVRGDPASPHVDGLWPEHRGMLAPELIAGQSTITVTDCLAWLFRLFGEGYRDVLFMRGLDDANASRIAAAGVKTVVVHCHRQKSEYAAIFQAAGLRVTMDRTEAETAVVSEAPAPVNPDALNFVEADEQVAIYQAGAVRYAITVRDDGKTIRKVVIRAHGKSCQHDLDLAVHAQRERTAKNAAQQVGLAPSVISAHLVSLLALVQEREAARDRGPGVAIADDDRAAAESFLAAPDLLGLVADDLTALGWTGETRTKHLLYLTAISRLLPHPVWAVYHGAGAAPWAGVDAVATLTPPEEKVAFHRLTSAAIMQADHRHRLLVIDQAENLRPDAALALRIMRERGTVAVLAAAAGPLDPRCRDGFLSVTVDESPEQTERILVEQRHQLGVHGIPATAVIQARHHAAQRMLERLPVVIPFADRIVFPANRVRHRDEHRWFLHLIAASALLHQRQRRREGGAVVASELDFSIAVNCTAGLIGCEAGGLGLHARRLLGELALREAKPFSIADLAQVLPEWTRWMFRAALQDLMDFGYLDSPRAGRGKLRLFRIGTRSSRVGGISLRPVGEPAPASEVGGWRKLAEPDSANFIPVRTGT